MRTVILMLILFLVLGCRSKQTQKEAAMVMEEVKETVGLTLDDSIPAIERYILSEQEIGERWVALEKKAQKLLSEEAMSNPRVFCQYKQKVSGYEVRFIWYPWEGCSEIAPVIIEFKKPNSTFYITMENGFSDSFLYEQAYEYKYQDREFMELDYVQPSDNGKRWYNSPFLFEDVNFDGVDELLITEWRGGQRENNRYDVYDIESKSVKKLDYPPFDYLDDWTEFDHHNKTIVRTGTSGAGDSSWEKYYMSPSQKNKHYPTPLPESSKSILDNYYNAPDGPFRLDSLRVWSTDNNAMMIEDKPGCYEFLYVNKGGIITFVEWNYIEK